jgi:tetratricopeptide (TPR) repeat protein
MPGGIIAYLIAIALAAMFINTVASLDFSQKVDFLIIELMKRSLYFCALAAGLLLVALQWKNPPRLDERPAPWILYGILISVGVFLIHNLIEFSIFEAGTTCLFGLFIGSAWGARNRPEKQKMRRAEALASFTLATAALLAFAIFVCVPICRAESARQFGDDALRAGRFDEAAKDYHAAFDFVPYDDDYAFHAGSALHYQVASLLANHRIAMVPQGIQAQILAYYGLAISRNPANINAHLARANFALLIRNKEQAIDDFEKALELNPNEVSIHLDYARALRELDMPEKAMQQLQLALKLNDELDAAEPKRLSADRVAAIKTEIAELQQLAQ